MIKKWSVTKRKKETKNCSNYTKHTVDANKVCSYWSEKTKMFTFQMSEQELIVILKVRTRQQQNSWPSDKEFLEQIIDNPARTNETKKRWEATLIVGILIIFSKIIFCYCSWETTIEYLMRFLFTVLYDMSTVLLFLMVCALGVFTSYFWRVSKF